MSINESAVEIWTRDKYVRGAKVYITDAGVTICFHNGAAEVADPIAFMRSQKIPPRKLLAIMGGRERWQHDLPLGEAKKLIDRWRKLAGKNGFTKYEAT